MSKVIPIPPNIVGKTFNLNPRWGDVTGLQAVEVIAVAPGNTDVLLWLQAVDGTRTAAWLSSLV